MIPATQRPVDDLQITKMLAACRGSETIEGSFLIHDVRTEQWCHVGQREFQNNTSVQADGHRKRDWRSSKSKPKIINPLRELVSCSGIADGVEDKKRLCIAVHFRLSRTCPHLVQYTSMRLYPSISKGPLLCKTLQESRSRFCRDGIIIQVRRK